MDLSCFKAYDIRGRIPDQLNTEVAFRIGKAYARWLQPKTVIVGRDIRLSSPEMSEALIEGLISSGVHVLTLGECGTEEVYFATEHYQADGGIMVTASHNPKDYNGMKLVQAGSVPISGDSGLLEIKQLVADGDFQDAAVRGRSEPLNHRKQYLQRLLTYHLPEVKPERRLKIVVNPGNGGAGAVIDLLEQALPFDFIKVHHKPDGNFPNGVPNPLLIENRKPTIAAIKEHKADLGLAWDGDFDRCFFFDENARFIEGYYIVGLLAEAFLSRYPGSAVVHDPRLTWNTMDICNRAGGRAVMSKTGHAFMKERMRSEDAVYGGEMSAHHYFRDFAYCDSGMVPWLLVTGLMLQHDKGLAALVDQRMLKFPASGEINRRLDDPEKTIAAIQARYQTQALSIDDTDGLSMEFDQWRFNLRMSNTEPVIRLNVESRGDASLMTMQTDALLNMVGGEKA
ncbi:MAG TPA: phosphomannomutase [Gammaproteobacteria bacterium]|nr:phosphomannomutase [Gammaproteobacteria bacterium]